MYWRCVLEGVFWRRILGACAGGACLPYPAPPLAQLCKYLEEFGTALAGYRLSAALDPGWGAPGEQADALARHLQLFHQLIQDKVSALDRRELGSTHPAPLNLPRAR